VSSAATQDTQDQLMTLYCLGVTCSFVARKVTFNNAKAGALLYVYN